MSKSYCISLLLAFFSLSALSQSAFQQGDKIIDLGIGLGSPYWGSGFKSSLPVNPKLNVEFGITEEISVGGTVSYSGSKYSYGSYTVKYSGIFVGGRGAYHFPVNEKIDPYLGASAGFVIVTVKDNAGYGSAASSGFGYGAFGGARYYFQQNLGVNAELGYSSFSFLSIGLSLKF